MRDLEIRGTGDILGTRQHGHIAAVGFHLYTRLLAEAVRRMRRDRGLPVSLDLPELQAHLSSVNVELPITVGLPTEYVPDKNTRLGLYRRMANMRTTGEIDALQEEFADRFGPPPESVLNLLFQFKVKLLAEKSGLSSITAEAGQLVFRFPDGEVPENLPDFEGLVRIGRTALWMPYIQMEDWREPMLAVLEKLRKSQMIFEDIRLWAEV
jgi:transcription-repair coupling factor (superfamily II helicase)